MSKPNKSRKDLESQARHPMQPVYLDESNVARFKSNPIVRFLLDAGHVDLNHLAIMPFSNQDREHFAQLIGYSVSGFSELSYVSDETCELADKQVEALMKPAIKRERKKKGTHDPRP